MQEEERPLPDKKIDEKLVEEVLKYEQELLKKR